MHAQLYSIFLFCYIITQLPSTSLKTELQFLSVSVTRHFRPKLVHLNESLFCKSVDRTLKILFIEGSDCFLRPIISELWKLLVFGSKKHKYKKTSKIFYSKNKSFHNFHKVSKSTILNTMAVDL